MAFFEVNKVAIGLMMRSRPQYLAALLDHQQKGATNMWFEVLIPDLHNQPVFNVYPVLRGCRDVTDFLKLTAQHELHGEVKMVWIIRDMKTAQLYDQAMMAADASVVAPSTLRRGTDGVLRVDPERSLKARPPMRATTVTPEMLAAVHNPVEKAKVKELGVVYICQGCRKVIDGPPTICCSSNCLRFCTDACMHANNDVLVLLCGRKCRGCFRKEAPPKLLLQRCGRCKRVYYCSVDCQRADWLRGHNHACGEFVKQCLP